MGNKKLKQPPKGKGKNQAKKAPNAASNSSIILIGYQAFYVMVMLGVLPSANLGETANAAVTAVLTVASAILIGKTYFDERNVGNARRSIGLLSLCALVTVYVLFKCGLYA